MAQGLSKSQFLTVQEVADLMRVSSMTVYRLIKAGELPAVLPDATLATVVRYQITDAAAVPAARVRKRRRVAGV